MAIKIRATPWSWTRLGGDQDLIFGREEFQRRIREQQCLKWGQPGHLARSCTTKDGPKPFNAQARSWQPAKKIAHWQTRPKIREIEVEQGPEHWGNEECPQ